MIDILVSEQAGPDGWKHATVRVIAATEVQARAEAQQAKEQILKNAASVRWRVPFEYKDQTSFRNGHRWHGFARFSFREQK